jgi:hypothetical protein
VPANSKMEGKVSSAFIYIARMERKKPMGRIVLNLAKQSNHIYKSSENKYDVYLSD